MRVLNTVQKIKKFGDDYESDKNVEQNLQMLTHCQIYIKVFTVRQDTDKKMHGLIFKNKSISTIS